MNVQIFLGCAYEIVVEYCVVRRQYGWRANNFWFWRARLHKAISRHTSISFFGANTL